MSIFFQNEVGVVGCGYHVLSLEWIYFMKLDPNNDDVISSVRDDLGGDDKYRGTVVGIDECIYVYIILQSTCSLDEIV